MAGTNKLRIPLRVVFYKEDDAWIAHCLEFDLLGDGATREAACGRLMEAVFLQIEFSLEDKNPQNLFTPADSRIQEMFAEGTDIAAGALEIQGIEQSPRSSSKYIDSISAREYSGCNSVFAMA